jgi:hypothetical protein
MHAIPLILGKCLRGLHIMKGWGRDWLAGAGIPRLVITAMWIPQDEMTCFIVTKCG